MLSRAADSVYWMSRYLERADNISRFIGVNMHLMLDLGMERGDDHWNALLRTSNDDEVFARRYKHTTEQNVIKFMTFDEQNPNSILSCVSKARENARTVREIISSDMWELINELYHFVLKHSRKRNVKDLEAFYIQIRKLNHLLIGLAENCMSHGEGWHFARVGRLLERADKTARILDVKYFLLLPGVEYVDSPHDTVEWGAVLKSASAFEMYRKRFHRANYHDVTDFLIFDREFPRSISYCLRKTLHSLQAIGDEHGVESAARHAAEELDGWLRAQTIADVWKIGLHEFIDDVQIRLNTLGQRVFESYFAFRTPESPGRQAQSH